MPLMLQASFLLKPPEPPSNTFSRREAAREEGSKREEGGKEEVGGKRRANLLGYSGFARFLPNQQTQITGGSVSSKPSADCDGRGQRLHQDSRWVGAEGATQVFDVLGQLGTGNDGKDMDGL